MNGDPAQDVIQASVVFLVDAKLVLLQPTKDESGSLKYDMRIIANEVEYFSFTRDQVPVHETGGLTPPASVLDEDGKGWNKPAPGLLDSLWYFDGHRVQCWPDVQDLLKAAADNTKSLPAPVPVPVDFYPTSIALTKGVIFGLESELFQRRELQFASYRFSIRVRSRKGHFCPMLTISRLNCFSPRFFVSISPHQMPRRRLACAIITKIFHTSRMCLKCYFMACWRRKSIRRLLRSRL